MTTAATATLDLREELATARCMLALVSDAIASRATFTQDGLSGLCEVVQAAKTKIAAVESSM